MFILLFTVFVVWMVIAYKREKNERKKYLEQYKIACDAYFAANPDLGPNPSDAWQKTLDSVKNGDQS